MSPSYLAAFVHCLDVLFWRNALSDYGYIFASPDSMVQVLGCSSTCPLVCNDRALVRQWRKVWVPQLHFLVSGRCPWLAGRAGSLVQVWRRQLSPTDAACPHVFLDKVVDMPLLCNGRCLVFGCRNCGFSAVAVHRLSVDVPAIMQLRVSQWEVPQIQFIA